MLSVGCSAVTRSSLVSAPCILTEKDRYLLYYSARDCNDEYTDGEGRKLIDRSGVYAHIGVAVWDTTEASL